MGFVSVWFGMWGGNRGENKKGLRSDDEKPCDFGFVLVMKMMGVGGGLEFLVGMVGGGLEFLVGMVGGGFFFDFFCFEDVGGVVGDGGGFEKAIDFFAEEEEHGNVWDAAEFGCAGCGVDDECACAESEEFE